MRWLGAAVLAVGVVWAASGMASQVVSIDEFGALNGRLYPIERHCPAVPETPEPCPPSLSTLCQVQEQAGDLTTDSHFLADLAKAFRLRGLPNRARHLEPPTKTYDIRERVITQAFSDVVAAVFKAIYEDGMCRPEDAQAALSTALDHASRLAQPDRTAAMAQVVYYQARLGFPDDARETFGRLIAGGVPAKNTEYTNKWHPHSIPDILSLNRSLTMAAAVVGHWDLAIARMPQSAESVAHLAAQLALEQGREDIALRLANADIPWRSVVYQALIGRDHRDAVRAIVDAAPASSLLHVEQVALAWATTDPAAAYSYVRHRVPNYIASALITAAALDGNADGALKLLKGPGGILAFRRRATMRRHDNAEDENAVSWGREEVDFAAAVGYTALALTEKGRRGEALRLLAQTEPLFRNLDAMGYIGDPPGIIAEAYGFLGEPARGLALIEFRRQAGDKDRNAQAEREKRSRAQRLAWLIAKRAYLLAHRDKLDVAATMLPRYPEYRVEILQEIAAGAADSDRPVAFLNHGESRYSWWQVMATLRKSTDIGSRFPRD
jgi:hypothetical protein